MSADRATGKFVFTDGSTYDGEYKTTDNGGKVKDGKGIYIAGNISNSTMIFILLNVKAIPQWAGPESYEGSWEDDKMNGTGIYKFSSGAIYEGEFSNGLVLRIFHPFPLFTRHLLAVINLYLSI